MPEHEDCRRLLGALSDYLDGDLQEELCAEIERHLQECENCRIVVDTLRRTIYLYRAAAEPGEIPQDVRQRLYHRLNLDEFLAK
jgi:anti-sigma factor (TIGR02949 family)